MDYLLEQDIKDRNLSTKPFSQLNEQEKEDVISYLLEGIDNTELLTEQERSKLAKTSSFWLHTAVDVISLILSFIGPLKLASLGIDALHSLTYFVEALVIDDSDEQFWLVLSGVLTLLFTVFPGGLSIKKTVEVYVKAFKAAKTSGKVLPKASKSILAFFKNAKTSIPQALSKGKNAINALKAKFAKPNELPFVVRNVLPIEFIQKEMPWDKIIAFIEGSGAKFSQFADEVLKANGKIAVETGEKLAKSSGAKVASQFTVLSKSQLDELTKLAARGAGEATEAVLKQTSESIFKRSYKFLKWKDIRRYIWDRKYFIGSNLILFPLYVPAAKLYTVYHILRNFKSISRRTSEFLIFATGKGGKVVKVSSEQLVPTVAAFMKSKGMKGVDQAKAVVDGTVKATKENLGTFLSEKNNVRILLKGFGADAYWAFKQTGNLDLVVKDLAEYLIKQENGTSEDIVVMPIGIDNVGEIKDSLPAPVAATPTTTKPTTNYTKKKLDLANFPHDSGHEYIYICERNLIQKRNLATDKVTAVYTQNPANGFWLWAQTGQYVSRRFTAEANRIKATCTQTATEKPSVSVPPTQPDKTVVDLPAIDTSNLA